MDGATLLPEWDQELAGTRAVLSRLAFDRADFRPHERSWTLVELATHVANLPMWLPMTLQSEELDLAEPLPSPPLPESRDDLVARFDANVARARAALAAASGEDLGVPWTLRRGTEVFFTVPRLAVVRTMILNHLIHHRGQLTVYLRMTGTPVPGLYGPSADELAAG
ncbi:MAG TPA: DinB family protein [Longimicrobiales bacterium]|nr:DinB family protein [Longimicrobiales bacterium]